MNWIVVGLFAAIVVFGIAYKIKNRANEFVQSGPVRIDGGGSTVVDQVKKLKDRCLGAFS